MKEIIRESVKSSNSLAEVRDSLFDVFMGVLFGSFTPRIQEEHPILLKSCLIQPNLEESFPVILEKTYVALVEEGHRQCFTLYFKTEEKIHSFVLSKKRELVLLKSARASI